MPRTAVQLPTGSSPLARARRTFLKLLRFWVAPGAARFEHRCTGQFWVQLHPTQEPPPGMGEVWGLAGSSRPSLRSALTAAPSLLLAWLRCPGPPLLHGHPQPRPVAFAFAWGGRETSGFASCSPRSPGPGPPPGVCHLLAPDAQGLLLPQARPPSQARPGAPAGPGASGPGGGQQWGQRPAADR